MAQEKVVIFGYDILPRDDGTKNVEVVLESNGIKHKFYASLLNYLNPRQREDYHKTWIETIRKREKESALNDVEIKRVLKESIGNEIRDE